MRKTIFALLFALALPASASAQSWPSDWKSYTQTGNPKDIVPSTGTDNSVAAWFEKKVDVTNGTATGLTLTNGSATGTDISAAYVDSTFPLKNYLTSSSTNRFTVYLGSVSNFGGLASDVQSSLSAGNIGLYEHGVSLNPAVYPAATIAAVQAVWAKTGTKMTTAAGGGGTGLAELGCCTAPTQADFDTFGGRFPLLADVNLPDSEGGDGGTASMTDADEADLEKGLSTITSAPLGSKSVAPFMRPDATKTNIWSTDAIYAPARKLALAAGAFALDIPPTFALALSNTALDNYADALKWGIDNHLRVTLVVSPFASGSGGCYYDDNYLANARQFITYMLSKAPPPTEYAALDYCDPRTSGITVNGASGDSVANSDNQVALYLSTLPVSDPGTAVPTLTGGLSEADALAQGALYSPLNNTNMTFDAPYASTTNPMPVNDLRNVIRYNVSALNGMAYQSPNNVNISGGNLFGVANPLNITIENGNVLMQGTGAQTVYTGSGGNTVLTSSTVDPYVALYDPYTNNMSGIHFGSPSDSNAPTLTSNYGTGAGTGLNLVGSAENLLTLKDKKHTTDFYEVGVSSDNKFVIGDVISNADGITGIEFAPLGVAQANRPTISSSEDGSTIYVTDKTTTLTGTLNVNGAVGLGSTLNIHSGNTLVFGSDGTVPVPVSGDGLGNLKIAGNVSLGGTLNLLNQTKTQILAISSPPSGMIVNDSTDNVPVIYENGSWYPLTLGTALSN